MNNIRNIGKSIRIRLLNIAKKENIFYQTILTRYFQERLLYRMSLTQYKSNFFLKGGALMYAFEKHYARPTLDIDKITAFEVIVEPTLSLNLVTDEEKVTESVTKLNDTLNEIIEFCSVPRSMTEIMEHISLKHRYNVKHRYIDPLIKGGFLVMTIPEKPNSRSQKYKRALT